MHRFVAIGNEKDKLVTTLAVPEHFLLDTFYIHCEMEATMNYKYPTPGEVGIPIPVHLRAERFEAGFLHGLQGNHLARPEHMRLSFREGFRAAKLYLKVLRKEQGIHEFPLQGRLRFKAAA